MSNAQGFDPSEYDLQEESGGGLPAFVRDPLGLLRRRWPWMALAFVLGAAATAAAVAWMGTEYESKATVLVTSQQLSPEYVRSTTTSGEFEKINAIVGEVLSRRSLAALIEEFDLYRHEGPTEVSTEGRLARVREDITIEPHRGVGAPSRYETARLYAVTFRHEEPEVAARVTNALAGEFISTHLRMRNRQAHLATEFLRRELERTESQLLKQEREIARYKERYRGELPDELEANLAQLERLQQQRQSLALQIAEAETRLATLSAGDSLPPDSPEARLAELERELDRRLSVLTEEHPNVVSLRRQVESLQAELATRREAGEAAPSRSVLVAAAQRTLAELRRQLSRVEARIADLDERVSRSPSRQLELSELERRAEVLRERYREFLRKVNEAELAEKVESAQQGERAAILDPAVPPSTPIYPPLLLLAGGIVASLGLAAVVGVGLEWLDPVLVSAEQIEREFAAPVLGSVPQIS